MLCLVFSQDPCICPRVLHTMPITMFPIQSIRCKLPQLKDMNGWLALDVTWLWVITPLFVLRKPFSHQELPHMWLKLWLWEETQWNILMILILTSNPLTLPLHLCSLTCLVCCLEKTCHSNYRVLECNVPMVFYSFQPCALSTNIGTFHINRISLINC